MNTNAEQVQRVTKTHNNIHIRAQYHRYDPDGSNPRNAYFLMGINNKTNRFEMLNLGDELSAYEWHNLYNTSFPSCAYISIQKLIDTKEKPTVSV